MIYPLWRIPVEEVCMLDAQALSAVFAEVLPGALIDEFAETLGVVERERKVDIRCLVRALVLAAGTPSGGLQADALRAYGIMNVASISRAAFYKRFNAALAGLMSGLAAHVLGVAGKQDVDLPGFLGGVVDWWIVDSETVKLPNALKEEFPGTGDYAAIKVHKTFSVGTSCPIAFHFSPAREHDSLHLEINEHWAGHGLLADLGYASLARLQACKKHGVEPVSRIESSVSHDLACKVV